MTQISKDNASKLPNKPPSKTSAASSATVTKCEWPTKEIRLKYGIIDKNVSAKRITDFQSKVYEALCQVPLGKVTTYKLLAQSIDCKSNQAVGRALERNPFAPCVPCHRVIRSDGSIGGFQGYKEGGRIQKKIDLLKSEGVEISDDGMIEKRFVYSFD